MASSRGDSSGNIKPSPNPSPKQPGLLVVWAGLVLKDLLHFNASGYRLQGNMLVSALMGVYNAKAEFPMETRSLSHYLDSMYSRLTPLKTVQQEAPAGSIPLFHKVKPGERLFSISKRYKVPVETIKSINHLQKPYTIRPGDRIKIR